MWLQLPEAFADIKNLVDKSIEASYVLKNCMYSERIFNYHANLNKELVRIDGLMKVFNNSK